MPRPRLSASLALGALALGSLSLAGPSAAADTVTASGVLEVIHEDHFDEARSVHRYGLLSSDGQRTELLFGDRGPEGLGARTVRVTGTAVRPGVLRVPSTAAVTDTGSASGPAGPTADAVPATTEKRVAVLLLDFSDRVELDKPITVDSARSHLFGGSTVPSVNGFLGETSFSQLALVGAAGTTGDVYDWVTIPAQSTDTCAFTTWGQQARSAAAAQGFDETRYDHVVHLMPPSTCGFAGVAYMPGTYSWTVLAAGRGYSLEDRLRGVTSHELGHNFGIHHAGAASCTDRSGNPVMISSTCTVREYGDPHSVMGMSHLERQYHGYQKGRLGWLTGADDTTTVTTSGTYPLVSVSSDVPGPQVVRIPRPKAKGVGGDDFYYLELRKALPSPAFDDFGSADAAVTGVSIRLAPDYGVNRVSQLFDATPSTPSFVDAPLLAGGTFADPATGVRVVVNGVSDGAATVTVTLPSSGGPRNKK